MRKYGGDSQKTALDLAQSREVRGAESVLGNLIFQVSRISGWTLVMKLVNANAKQRMCKRFIYFASVYLKTATSVLLFVQAKQLGLTNYEQKR